MLMYDAGDRESFTNVRKWMKMVKEVRVSPSVRHFAYPLALSALAHCIVRTLTGSTRLLTLM